MDLDYVRYELCRLAEARLQAGGLSKKEQSRYQALCLLERSMLAVVDEAAPKSYEGHALRCA